MLAIETRPIPLTIDEKGIVLVTGTRIPLDTIIYAQTDSKSIPARPFAGTIS